MPISSHASRWLVAAVAAPIIVIVLFWAPSEAFLALLAAAGAAAWWEYGQAVMKILAEIARERGHAVLIVTHDPRLLPFADRVVHIEDGRIIAEERGGIRQTLEDQ